MSTDTAFALGVLALVAPRATRLRVRLLTIVVVDDLVALLVIATVYTEDVDVRSRSRSRPGCSALKLTLQLGADHLAAAGRVGGRDRHVGRAVRVRHRPAAGRARRRARHERVPAGAQRPRAGDRADPLVPGAADPGAGAHGPARPELGDLAERAAAVPAASLDQLRDRAAVRSGQRGHTRRRGPARGRDDVARVARDPVRLRDRQAAGRHDGRVDRDPFLGRRGPTFAELAGDLRRRHRGRDRVHGVVADRDDRLRGPRARGGQAGRAGDRDRGGAA